MRPIRTPLRIGYLPSISAHFRNRIFASPVDFDGRLAPFVRLRQHLEGSGHRLETADDPDEKYDVLIIHRIDVNAGRVLRHLATHPHTRLIYAVTEEQSICPLHDPAVLNALDFDAVLSWNPVAIAKGAVSYAYPNPSLIYDAGEDFAGRGLLVAIAANKLARPFARGELYTYRRHIFRDLMRDSRFHLFGPGWHSKDMAGTYQGLADGKSGVLRRYRFNLIVENSREAGGITEKIFDCMANGCVPVYLGAPDVANWLPKDCYVDLEQIGPDNLCRKLAEMPEPTWERHREAMKAYLGSGAYDRFSVPGFVAAMEQALGVAMESRRARDGRTLRHRLAMIVAKRPSILFYRGGQKLVADLIHAAAAELLWGGE